MRKRYFTLLIALSYCFSFTSCSKKEYQVSLAGPWRFKTDSLNVGATEKWYSRELEETVNLPGSMTENLKGNDLTVNTQWTGSIYDSSWYFSPEMARYRQKDNLKFPFWLTPVKYYVGPAWYQRNIEIPKSWAGKRVVLYLERAHWETTLWVDDKQVGQQNSLVAPHIYDLTEHIEPGTHTLSIRVDNRIKDINVGADSHSISDHTQGNWNGIIGKMELQARDKVWIDDLQVFPDVASRSAKVKITIQNATGAPVHGVITLQAKSFNGNNIHEPAGVNINFSIPEKNSTVAEADFPLGKDALLWDEFDRNLYTLTASLKTENSLQDNRATQFALREFSIDGTRLTVNGRHVFLRGDVDCAIFPLTGYPPMDVESWEKIFKIRKNHGLNHVRFHSWCPPQAAFLAADRVGFYLQAEGPSWANHGTTIGDGKPIDKFIYDETNRMAKYYGNHPSFCMMAYGNEPAGGHQVEYLNEFVNYWAAKDSRRVYTSASVGSRWPWVSDVQFVVKSNPRGVKVDSLPNTAFDHRKPLLGVNKPYISHEIGQYCVFPNFKEISKYKGVFRAKNFELFQEQLTQHGMGDQAEDFLMASGKLQALFYKAEIEAALRTPGFAGFQLLQLSDFSGQGTALVGVLDAFFEQKGYITPKEFSRFCNETVPLARIPKFVYRNNERFKAALEIAHFGKQPIKDATVDYKIMFSDSSTFTKGTFENMIIDINNVIPAGTVDIDLSKLKDAVKLILEVSIRGTKFSNAWEIWVYPSTLTIPDASSGVIVTSELNENIREQLANGAKVFLNAARKVEHGKEVSMHFKPVFWNTSWFQMKPPHTLGHLTDAGHPLFNYFPTEFHSNYQWWEIVHKQRVMILDNFPQGFKPLVQPIDTWFLNRKLGLIFEAKVGKGKIIVSSADLTSNLESRPAAKQLYYSTLRYMESKDFQPKFEVPYDAIKELFEVKERKKFSTYSKDSPDELQPKKNKQP